MILKYNTLNFPILLFLSVTVYFSSIYNPITTYVSYGFVFLVSVVFFINKLKVSEASLITIMLLFTCLAMLSFFKGMWLGTSISETRKVIINTFVFIALLAMSDKQWFLTIKAICYASVCASAISILYFGLTLSRSDLLGGPNLVGVNLSIGFFWGVYLYNLTREKKYILHCIIISFGVLSTISGRSLLFCSLLLTLFFTLKITFSSLYILLSKRINKFFLLKGLGIFFVFVAIVSVLLFLMINLFSDNYWVNYLLDKATNTDSSNNLVRFYLAEKGLSYFDLSGFFGTGLDSSRMYFLNDIGIETYTHNNYLELLIGVGPLGLMLYIFFLIYMVFRALKVMIYKDMCCDISYLAIAFFIGLLLLSFFMSLYSNILVGITILAINNRLHHDSHWFSSFK
ncbi:O-antigen ligase family protein [Vibrio diabolicus]|uniref:O-antigen ligase family protein n=1 Tax=Vibrio diabolicus TaxID=50719 RepID=UPI0037538502